MLRINCHNLIERIKLLAEPPEKGLLWISLLNLFGYLLFFLFISIGGQSAPALLAEPFLFLTLSGLLYLYFRGYQLVRQITLTKSTLLILGVIALLIFAVAMITPPFQSTDIYGYVNRGWQQWAYHTNPYTTVISQLPNWANDPMLTDHWINNPCPYGFVFAHLTRWLCALGQGNLLLTVMLFKFLNLLVHLTLGGLIYVACRRLKYSTPLATTYLYLLNPYILLQFLSNGHNGLLLAVFSTGAATLAVLGGWIWVLPVLLAGSLIKYLSVLTLPFSLLLIQRKAGWKILLGSLGLCAVLFLLVAAPYLKDYPDFILDRIAANAVETSSSLHSVLVYLVDDLGGFIPGLSSALSTPQANQLFKRILLLGFLGFAVYLGRNALKEKPYSISSYLNHIFLIQFVFVCFISPKFFPWYLGMFFPLALLLPESAFSRKLMLWVISAQLFAFTFLTNAHYLDYLVLTALPIMLAFRTEKQKQTQGSLQLQVSAAD